MLYYFWISQIVSILGGWYTFAVFTSGSLNVIGAGFAMLVIAGVEILLLLNSAYAAYLVDKKGLSPSAHGILVTHGVIFVALLAFILIMLVIGFIKNS